MEQYYPARYETKQMLRLMNMALDQLEQQRNVVELALDASDIERINRAGKMAAVLDLEGGFDLDGDLDVLRSLHRLGLRVVQLSAHNWANEFADSCCAPARWHGLTDHGRAVVREMNRLGMVINVSHASDEALAQALEVSTDPIVATHHGLRSPERHPPQHARRPHEEARRERGRDRVPYRQRVPQPPRLRVAVETRRPPFWDTSEIGREGSRLSIYEIDRRLAPQFPMVGPACQTSC